MSTGITSVAIVSSTIDSTPIGQTTPAAANVSTPLQTDNSQAAVNSAWAKYGFSIGISATDGLIILPAWLGGFIIQWGNNKPTTGAVVFSQAYTQTPSVQVTTIFLSGNNGYVAINSGDVSTTGFTPTCNNPSVTNCNWFAIGH